VPSPDLVLKVIGIGMATAIFIDATVVRMLLVPAVMHLLGRRNWWMPRSFERVVPQLHVEGHAENFLPGPVGSVSGPISQPTVAIRSISSSSRA
jgi:RND superfamily putative drug exporter